MLANSQKTTERESPHGRNSLNKNKLEKMGKKALWLVIGCLVIASLVLASCGQPATGEEVTGEEPTFTLKGEYTNQEFGFSIKYPAEYEEETPRSNEVFRARTPTGFLARTA